MRQPSSKIRLAVLIALAAVKCFAADAVVWTPAADGLQLGIRMVSPKSVEVLLKNTGSTELSVFVAQSTAHATGYLFRFAATAPNGNRCAIVDFRPESNLTSGGLVLPIVSALVPGAIQNFTFPTDTLACMTGSEQVSLSALLAQNYTFHVSLEVQQSNLNGAALGGIPKPANGQLWIESLVSREIGLP